MLKLKLQYFGHLMQRTNALEKTLLLGKMEFRGRTGQQRMRWWEDITDSRDGSLSKIQQMVKDRKDWRATVHGVANNQTWLSNWTTTTNLVKSNLTESNRRRLVIMVVRVQNTAKHLTFTSHFSIKGPYHTSSPTYLYLIRNPRYTFMWAKRKFRPSMPWPMCENLQHNPLFPL